MFISFSQFCSKTGWQRRLRGQDQSSAAKTLSYGEKIAKIGSIDPEIIDLRAIILKKKERNNANKKYSRPDKFSGRVKLCVVDVK